MISGGTLTDYDTFFCSECEGEEACTEECQCDSCIEDRAAAHYGGLRDTYD